MDWSLILQWSFLIALLTSAIRLAMPVLLAVLGEMITERSGVLNLGLEGVMIVGAVAGFMTAYFLEAGILAGADGSLSSWIGLVVGALAGMLMGLIMSVLSITLKADQTISGVTLVVFGVGLANYIYRQGFSELVANVRGMEQVPIPLLSEIPVVGEIFFNHQPTVYMTAIIVVLVSIFLFKTTWGLNIRAAGENPAAAETSGINVNGTRYVATLLGTALVGLGGAVLTVVQLKLFREGITAGRGWIAVALVIFARWRPGLAVLGTLLFGLMDAVQYRIQALSAVQRGSGSIPYEFLLMMPYVVTLLVLYLRADQQDAPEMLGRPYERGH